MVQAAPYHVLEALEQFLHHDMLARTKDAKKVTLAKHQRGGKVRISRGLEPIILTYRYIPDDS
eukprot:4523209-Amphidinium_carterae.1